MISSKFNPFDKLRVDAERSRSIKVQSSKFKGGFTLIELLVALVVIASFGTIVVNIITSTFRGTSKTDVVNKVRENGNYAISQMSRTVRYAKSFDGASTDGVTNWTCEIVPPIPVQYKAVKITSFDGTTTVFSCEANTINTNGASLMDAGPTGSVLLSPGTCFFTCARKNTLDSPTIGIKFTLTSKITSGIAEKQASIPFETSIKVRN
jgi:prepilin-type N-terminal cleavage/methylation domain-containing protein